MREIEAKIRLAPGEIESIGERLRASPAERGPLDNELNVLFEAADGHLQPAGETLRLRTFDGRADAALTYKGPSDPRARFKSREELEVRVSDGSTARQILEALGYRATGQYTKRRQSWSLFGAAVALDRLASGDYLEVEGDEDSIGSVITWLGLADRPHVPEGYATLEARAATKTT